jgi:hypothetical protein
LNQESSPDRLAFQVAQTTISPNYPGEEFKTPDRQILVVSADAPPQDGETDEQRQEHETPMLPEPSGDNKSSLLLPQVLANHWLTPVKSTPMLGNKHPRHQLPSAATPR